MSLVKARDVLLVAEDNYPLGARFWALTEGDPPNAVALINAGAGIALGYYERFAQFLAGNGVPTLIYDYRGIGRSRRGTLRSFKASVLDWGSKDCAAALSWLAKGYPSAKKVVIGHSIGGFVTGFVANGFLVDRMVLVGAHTGYWGDYATRARPTMYLLWHVMMPCLTRALGYFPGRRLHLLEDLPAGVALEWANRRRPDFWWNLKGQDGGLDIARVDEIRARFLAIRAPTLALRFTDDPFATEAATSRVLGLFQNCPATPLVITPSEAHEAKIGHFGFFRSRFSDTLWPRIAGWLRVDARDSTQLPTHPHTPSESPAPFPPRP